MLAVFVVVMIGLLGLLGHWTVAAVKEPPEIFNIKLSIAVGVFTGLVTGLVVTAFSSFLPALNPPSPTDTASRETVDNLLAAQTGKLQSSLNDLRTSLAEEAVSREKDQKDRLVATGAVAMTCIAVGWIVGRRQ